MTATTTTPARALRTARPRLRATRVRTTGAARAGLRTVAPVRSAPRSAARAGREFVLRAARDAAADGVRQFLDVSSAPGTGPGAHALHRTVQEAAPGAKLVCCDRDPLAHAQALDGGAPGDGAPGDDDLGGGDPGGASRVDDETLALVHADLGDPERILDAPGLSDTIDLGHPVALSVTSVPGGPAAYEAVQTLLGALPAGSRLALTLATADRREAARFLDGLEHSGAGIVTLPGGGFAGAARKP